MLLNPWSDLRRQSSQPPRRTSTTRGLLEDVKADESSDSWQVHRSSSPLVLGSQRRHPFSWPPRSPLSGCSCRRGDTDTNRARERMRSRKARGEVPEESSLEITARPPAPSNPLCSLRLSSVGPPLPSLFPSINGRSVAVCSVAPAKLDPHPLSCWPALFIFRAPHAMYARFSSLSISARRAHLVHARTCVHLCTAKVFAPFLPPHAASTLRAGFWPCGIYCAANGKWKREGRGGTAGGICLFGFDGFLEFGRGASMANATR